ncbi:MAG: hypothetical protein AAGH81_07215 [Bacteroidota bacterium]
MAKKDEEYSGIWMKIGCVLSALAILAILTIIVLFAFNLISGF